ncbi:hypothetical protein [Pantanalinema sp. GBBB05]|uniref:hypothetical protein n=1 Tax=Pantanalinema sp. GBBB05 TaxID=2604139 RepID=UPI001D46827D|nr:hypothetical protein [Pantanalinema sp. GBBB05]
MALDPLKLILQTVDQSSAQLNAIASKLAALEQQFASVNKQQQQFGDDAQKSHQKGIDGAKKHGSAVGDIAKGFAVAQAAIAIFQQVASKSFDLLIGQNIQLREQIQSTAAQLVSKMDVVSGGKVVEDTLQAIKVAQGPVTEQIEQIRKDAAKLSGVTSADLVPGFQAMANASGSLKLNLNQSREISTRLAAQAITLGLNAGQMQLYVSQIATGTIDPTYNLLAKSIGLNNERLRQLAAEGKLYAYIQQKTEAGLKGQEIISRSWTGVTSNIKEYTEILAQSAGAPLLDAVLTQLAKIEAFLKPDNPNYAGIKVFLDEVGAKFGTLFTAIGDTVEALIKALVPGFEGGKDAGTAMINAVLDGLIMLAGVAKNLAPIVEVIGKIVAGAVIKISESIDEARNRFAGLVSQLSKIPGMDKILGDPVKDAADAIEAYGNATNVLTNESTATLNKINEAKKLGSTLDDEQLKKNAKLGELAQGQIKDIDKQIAALKQFTPLNDEQRDQQQQQVSVLEKRREVLAKSIEDLKGYNKESQVKLDNKPLEDRGAIAAQLAAKAKAFQETLAKPLDLNQAKEAAKNLTDVTNQQYELGIVSRKEAERRLRTIANDSRLEVADRTAAMQALEKLRKTAGDREKREIEKQISQVEELRAKENISEAEATKRTTELKGKEIKQQLDNVNAAIKAEQELIKKGGGSPERLAQLNADREKIEAEQAKNSRDKRKQRYEQQIKDFDELQKLQDAARASGQTSELKYAEESLKIAENRTKAELAEIERRRKALNKNDKEGREELAVQEAEVAKKLEDARRKLADAKVKAIENEQKTLEGKLAQGNVSDEEYANKSLAIAQRRTNEELKEIRRRRALAKDPAELKELDAQEADIRKRQVDALEKFEQQKIAVLERSQKRALDAVRQSEIERETEIQRLLNTRQIRQVQADELKLKEQRKVTEQELTNEREKLAALEALPKLSDPIKEAERQQRIRDSRLRTSELTKQLVEGEFQLQQAHFRVISEQLDRQVQAAQNAATAQTLPLQRQQQLLDAQTKSLENQNKLLEARKSLQQSMTDYTTGMLDLLAKGAQNEIQRQQIAKVTAAIKLKALQVQQEMERQSLELQLQQEQAALRRQKIENTIAQIRNQADQAKAKAELSKVMADPTATEEQKQAAVLGLQASQQEGMGLQMQGQAIDEQAAVNQQVGQMRRFQMRMQQSLQTRQAQAAILETLPPGTREVAFRRMQRDILGEMFGNTSFAQTISRAGLEVGRQAGKQGGLDNYGSKINLPSGLTPSMSNLGGSGAPTVVPGQASSPGERQQFIQPGQPAVVGGVPSTASSQPVALLQEVKPVSLPADISEAIVHLPGIAQNIEKMTTHIEKHGAGTTINQTNNVQAGKPSQQEFNNHLYNIAQTAKQLRRGVSS